MTRGSLREIVEEAEKPTTIGEEPVTTEDGPLLTRGTPKKEEPVIPGVTVGWALYEDGALVINGDGEPGYNSHGSVVNKGELDISKSYPWEKDRNPIWGDCAASITSVEFAAPVAPRSMQVWFYRCQNLRSVDSANLDTSHVKSMGYTFYGCTSLTDFSALGFWDVSAVVKMESMFDSCTSLIDLLPLALWDVSSVTNMNGIFAGCASLSDLSPLAYWDVSSVTNMVRMFQACQSLTDLSPLAYWDVSAVTGMWAMFNKCTSLTDLSPLASWDVSAVTMMDSMFSGWASLTDLSPLASWDVSAVMSMTWMFADCISLADLSPLASWDVSSVTMLDSMFGGCTSLAGLSALARWDVSSVIDMRWMFQDCTSLRVARLDNWMPAEGCHLDSMFEGCSELETIYCRNTWKSSTSELMFSGCYMLHSAVTGRRYSVNRRGASMANPVDGYFTLPPVS